MVRVCDICPVFLELLLGVAVGSSISPTARLRRRMRLFLEVVNLEKKTVSIRGGVCAARKAAVRTRFERYGRDGSGEREGFAAVFGTPFMIVAAICVDSSEAI